MSFLDKITSVINDSINSLKLTASNYIANTESSKEIEKLKELYKSVIIHYKIGHIWYEVPLSILAYYLLAQYGVSTSITELLGEQVIFFVEFIAKKAENS